MCIDRSLVLQASVAHLCSRVFRNGVVTRSFVLTLSHAKTHKELQQSGFQEHMNSADLPAARARVGSPRPLLALQSRTMA